LTGTDHRSDFIATQNVRPFLRQNYTLPAIQYGDQSEMVFVLRPVCWIAFSNSDSNPDTLTQ